MDNGKIKSIELYKVVYLRNNLTNFTGAVALKNLCDSLLNIKNKSFTQKSERFLVNYNFKSFSAFPCAIFSLSTGGIGRLFKTVLASSVDQG